MNHYCPNMKTVFIYATNMIPNAIAICQTNLKCVESFPAASDANAERPGSCGSDALWCRECVVEVDDGRDIGSTEPSD
jgi:hypothetical protein